MLVHQLWKRLNLVIEQTYYRLTLDQFKCYNCFKEVINCHKPLIGIKNSVIVLNYCLGKVNIDILFTDWSDSSNGIYSALKHWIFCEKLFIVKENGKKHLFTAFQLKAKMIFNFGREYSTEFGVRYNLVLLSYRVNLNYWNKRLCFLTKEKSLVNITLQKESMLKQFLTMPHCVFFTVFSFVVPYTIFKYA